MLKKIYAFLATFAAIGAIGLTKAASSTRKTSPFQRVLTSNGDTGGLSRGGK